MSISTYMKITTVGNDHYCHSLLFPPGWVILLQSILHFSLSSHKYSSCICVHSFPARSHLFSIPSLLPQQLSIRHLSIRVYSCHPCGTYCIMKFAIFSGSVSAFKSCLIYCFWNLFLLVDFIILRTNKSFQNMQRFEIYKNIRGMAHCK
jgi:hypothetical protein